MDSPCNTTCTIAHKEACCGCPDYFSFVAQNKNKTKSKSKIEKIHPITIIDTYCDRGEMIYYLRYKCPKCERPIEYYKAETACDICGTFYDWEQKNL